MQGNQEWRAGPTAVLVSGGLDSAILLAELARGTAPIYPVYVRFGLIWEPAEERGLHRFLQALSAPIVQRLKVFEIPIGDLYGPHWSATGHETPGRDSPDAAVFLPGRTLLLFSQVAIWCHLRQIPTLAVGTLAGNPFPDSTPEFLEACERLVNAALGSELRFIAPYRGLSKREVLERGRAAPLAETMSCLRPEGDLHCGHCNKCGERQRAFAAAGLPDPTRYAVRQICGSTPVQEEG